VVCDPLVGDVTLDLALDGGLALESGDGEIFADCALAAVNIHVELYNAELKASGSSNLIVTKQGFSARVQKLMPPHQKDILSKAAMDAA